MTTLPQIVRNATIASFQRRVTVEAAFYMIYEVQMEMSNEAAEDIQGILNFTVTRKYTVEDAIEEILEILEG